MKIRPLRAELFHADGQTDRQTDMKLKVAFRNFANAVYLCLVCFLYSAITLRYNTNQLVCINEVLVYFFQAYMNF